MVEQTCPCPLAKLELGDPRREPILDCSLTRNGHPCYDSKKPFEGRSSETKPAILPGAEKHTSPESEGLKPTLQATLLG